jgi:leader peptidase (prepilin peptidase)/N-methyltransferase
VASRYFWVELLTAAIFSGIWWQYLIAGEAPWRATFYMAAAACLVAIIFIDWELFIIPDEINAVLLILGVGFQATQGSLMTALWGALFGWGLLFGIQLLGRLAFQKDGMGDGDIKMMRGVGALIGPLLLVANLGIAVVAGLVVGLTLIALAKRKAGSGAAEDEGPLPRPTPIPFMLFAGVWHLLCLDMVALVVKPLDRWVASKIPREILEQEDDWKPTVTTIPFGPYLAIGSVVAMLFAAPIEKGLHEYFYGPSEGGTMSGASAPME